MISIHPTAIVSDKAEIGDGSIIGAYCIINDNVIIGKNNTLISNVILHGTTTIGDGNKFYPFSVIGTDPQDLKYDGSETKLKIGSNNTIREYVTINRSNKVDEDTIVGDRNLIMEYVHIAHNCLIGNNIIIANAVQLAGHIVIQDFCTIGGATAIHQFVHIGAHAFIGGASAVKMDIAPYTRGQGNPYRTVGLNSIGLMRKGFSNDTIAQIKEIYNHFYRKALNTTQAMNSLDIFGELGEEQRLFVDFVANSQRGLSR